MEGKFLTFQTLDSENEWLKGAVTGYLKDQFSWEEHGEELHEECAGKLRLTNMGSNLILIQNEKEWEVREVIKGYEDWTGHWLKWWRDWRNTDVNLSRKVWTKWLGVPLQAWTPRFFRNGCASIGRMIAMHGVTEKKLRLDAAFFQIRSGMAQVDKVFNFLIDGMNFAVRVEEVKNLELELRDLPSDMWVSELESEFFDVFGRE